MSLPNVAQAAVDGNGHFTAPWRKWLAALERQQAQGGTDTGSLAADVAAIATALGSLDGTVANIPDQDAPSFTIVSPDNTIGITGTPASGTVLLRLSASMGNLLDVDLTGLADTYVLKWDAASGTWKPGAASGVTDGDKGDIVVSGSGTAWAIDTGAVTTAKIADDAVTNAKLANMAAGKIRARKTAGTGDPEDCTLSEVIDANLTSPADGDILMRTGGAWNRLGIGSAGQVLTVASGLPSWATGGGGSGAVSYVNTATVAGSAASTLTFSGLDLNTDQLYEIDFLFNNATASSTNIRLTYNTDTTSANYHINLITHGANATLVAGYVNNPNCAGMAASSWVRGRIVIRKDLNSHATAFVQSMRAAATSGILGQIGAHSWVGTANVTSISIGADVSNALAVGSYAKLFKQTGGP